jgi:hypothetical protein
MSSDDFGSRPGGVVAGIRYTGTPGSVRDDVESAERDAFTDADRQALVRVAAASSGLFA